MTWLREMSRTQRTGLLVLVLALVFLLGFVPQWLRVRSLDSQLNESRYELALLELEGRAGAALAEAQRGNYERARQLMTGFFSGLQGRTVTFEPSARQEVEAILRQRDEIITLLSRAEPEAVSRLNLIYTRYFAIAHPLGREAPASVTPSPSD